MDLSYKGIQVRVPLYIKNFRGGNFSPQRSSSTTAFSISKIKGQLQEGPTNDFSSYSLKVAILNKGCDSLDSAAGK